jgi:hypothetical protein
VNTYLPPQSTKEKFTSFAQDSFDYSSFIFVGLLSGVQQLQGSSPEFHTGPAAYGRYYWHSFADQTDENLWVEFLILYYPGGDRSWTKTGQRWALNVGIDGATFVFREFWPELNQKFFHQKVPQD